MNKKFRLTALLLALLMLFQSVAVAETSLNDLTKSVYDGYVAEAQLVAEDTLVERTLTAQDQNFNFAIEGEMPKAAELYVTYLGADSTSNIRENILGLGTLDEGAADYAFDITIVDDNAPWQPETPVEVTITGLDVTADSEVKVYHIPDSQPAVATLSLMDDEPAATMQYEEVSATAGDGAVTFVADGFSTYYVVAGTSDNSSPWDTTIREVPSEDSTYFVEPGTVIQFTAGTFDGVGSANITRNNRTITVGLDAYDGETTSFTVKTTGFFGSSRTVTLTFVVSNRTDIITGALTEHPIYLAIKTSGALPSEPGTSSGNYSRITSTYNVAGNWGTTFASSASNYIDASIANGMIISVDGSSTVGVYDPTGAKCMQYLKNIDWDQMMDIAVQENAVASNGVTLNSGNRNQYVVIPYVIKFMSEKGIGWHIDCMAVPKNRITLSYDINLSNYVVTSTTLVLPDTVTSAYDVNGTPSLDAKVGKITNVDVNDTVTATMNGNQYNLTFLGWSTDPAATEAEYVPGAAIHVEEDTVLYAVWKGERAPGTLEITKTVTTEDDSYTAPADDEFTFTVTFNGTAPLQYTITNADGEAGEKQSIRSGGTLKLKHGEFATIEDVPFGAYTVTESEVENYSASAINAEGTIISGSTVTAAFTNTYSKPTGSLTITKTIEGDVAPYINEARVFTFTVVGVGVNETVTVTVPAGETTATSEAIELRQGEYTVTETVMPDVYESVTEKETVTVTAGQTTNVEFVNKLKRGSLTITKTVIDENNIYTNTDRTFTFTVTDKDGNIVKDGDSETWSITVPANDEDGIASITIPNLTTGNYTVTEAAYGGYTTTVTATTQGTDDKGNVYGTVTVPAGGVTEVAFTNTVVTKDVTVTKVWNDESNKYKLRPEEITVNLRTGNAAYSKQLTIEKPEGTNVDKWTGTFQNVAMFDAAGNALTYTVSEATVDNYDTTYVPEDGAVDFTVEAPAVTITNTLQRTTLTIKKAGMKDIDAGQSFLFKVTSTGGVNLTIAINGNGSETISGLTVGDTVTVTEVESWSWRYTAEPTTIPLKPNDNVVTISNTRDNPYWLDGDCYAENVFGTITTAE